MSFQRWKRYDCFSNGYNAFIKMLYKYLMAISYTKMHIKLQISVNLILILSDLTFE